MSDDWTTGKAIEAIRHSLHVLADARKHAVSSHERHATEGFDALAVVCKRMEDADIRLSTIEQLLAWWMDAQGFDPCGGPENEPDWAAVNAYLLAGGELDVDNRAVQHCLSLAAKDDSEGS